MRAAELMGSVEHGRLVLVGVGGRLRGAIQMDWKLELVTIPVSNVDRAKTFYVEQAGFVLDHDHLVREGLRFVQLTPPGSSCSIAIGPGLTEAAPGPAQAQHLS